jgi:hypothetical protein
MRYAHRSLFLLALPFFNPLSILVGSRRTGPEQLLYAPDNRQLFHRTARLALVADAQPEQYLTYGDPRRLQCRDVWFASDRDRSHVGTDDLDRCTTIN